MRIMINFHRVFNDTTNMLLVGKGYNDMGKGGGGNDCPPQKFSLFMF